MKADYEVELIGPLSAARALALAREFVSDVRTQLGEEVSCLAEARLSTDPPL
jgi:hypothetical protein